MIQIGHDEELAQKLHAEELAKSTTRQEHEKYDFEKALELQKQLDEREEVASKSSQAVTINSSGDCYLLLMAWMERNTDVKDGASVLFKINLLKKKKKDEESSKQVEKETVQKEDVIPEQVVKESSRKAEVRLKRKASKARDDKDKRQKKQDDPEKLMEYVEVISDSEEVINVTPLAVKSPIMLNDFDREDLIVLFNEKYTSTRPGFDDLMLWGDMKIMFEPDSDNAVWKDHNSQELIE
ncbi:hypothetical protein Tco_0860445 [Tanacetum coccineum]|uniref:Uncharacterized protein n=1 Tax=Tanacetum coccineum TaxID=301880 RepID=A0ABQ5BFS8_9ASTR